MPKVPTGIKQFLVISPFCFSSYLLFTFKLNLLLHLSSRTTTSSSIWRCTCARSSPPCAAETTSALDHITSQSRFVPAVCVLLFSLLFVYFFSNLAFVCPQNVIDGDLCEQFNSMDPHKQKSVAEELDRTPPEVSKKLEDIRTRYAF